MNFMLSGIYKSDGRFICPVFSIQKKHILRVNNH